ncbi:hypothetical protein GFD17_01885 [Bifidobacterium sp. SMB2]|uniref:Zinc-ribbon domain-containing protein n=1 Tax=Bifidobacterium saimiriisciurei TaxID=2661627 RepID=A0ABX0C960_9BIFI|nr:MULTISPECIES: zinc ribbon domain-containing protein [Bifidobacterium]NEG95520.1 hypothetical protein [Bifidobacterium sp. SMB2]NEH11678.1 hypothetical protein [Bifidobacterium saimiriisciurei]
MVIFAIAAIFGMMIAPADLSYAASSPTPTWEKSIRIDDNADGGSYPTVSVSANGRYVAATRFGSISEKLHTVRIVDLRTGKVNTISAISTIMDPKSSMLYYSTGTSSSDPVRAVDMKEETERRLGDCAGGLMAVSRDGSTMLTTTENGSSTRLHQYDLTLPAEKHTFDVEGSVSQVILTEDNTTMYVLSLLRQNTSSTSAQYSFSAYSLTSGKQTASHAIQTDDDVSAVLFTTQFSDTHSVMVQRNNKMNVATLDPDSGKLKTVVPSDSGAILGYNLWGSIAAMGKSSVDDNSHVSWKNATMRTIDIGTGKTLTSVAMPERMQENLAGAGEQIVLNADGSTAYTVGEHGDVSAVNTSTGAISEAAHPDGERLVRSLTMTPDDSRLVMATDADSANDPVYLVVMKTHLPKASANASHGIGGSKAGGKSAGGVFGGLAGNPVMTIALAVAAVAGIAVIVVVVMRQRKVRNVAVDGASRPDSVPLPPVAQNNAGTGAVRSVPRPVPQPTVPQPSPQSALPTAAQPTSQWRFCMHCGTRMRVEARFCPSCGRSTQQQ